MTGVQTCALPIYPLVDASKPVAKRLQPFFSNLRAAVADAVPTIRDLDEVVRTSGPDNDLVDLTRLQLPLANRAIGTGAPDCGPGAENADDLQVVADDDYTQGSFGESTCALRNSQGNLSFFRAYIPDTVSWFNDFGPFSAKDDAAGGIARINTTLNNYSFSNPALPELTGILGGLLSPVLPTAFPGFTTQQVERCPGAAERDPGDGSTPFTDAGALTDSLAANGECDPSQMTPGP